MSMKKYLRHSVAAVLAVACFATSPASATLKENRGAKFRYMSSPEVEPIFAWGLMTTPAYLKDNEKEAVHIARAFAMGNVFCRAKPEECVRIFLKRFPTVRSPGIPQEQAISDQLRLLAEFDEYAPQAPGKPWGWYDSSGVEGGCRLHGRERPATAGDRPVAALHQRPAGRDQRF